MAKEEHRHLLQARIKADEESQELRYRVEHEGNLLNPRCKLFKASFYPLENRCLRLSCTEASPRLSGIRLAGQVLEEPSFFAVQYAESDRAPQNRRGVFG